MASIRIEGTEELRAEMERIANIDFRGIKNSIGQSIRTSTLERFDNEEDSEGKKWIPSIRASDEGGKTLSKTGRMKTSIKVESTSDNVEVGTNTIYAGSHQFGDKRTISARGRTIRRNMPKRAFFGINEEDKEEIKDTIEEALRR